MINPDPHLCLVIACLCLLIIFGIVTYSSVRTCNHSPFSLDHARDLLLDLRNAVNKGTRWPLIKSFVEHVSTLNDEINKQMKGVCKCCNKKISCPTRQTGNHSLSDYVFRTLSQATKSNGRNYLAKHSVTSDGHCLFRAIRHQMTGSENGFDLLRFQVADFMVRNPSIFANFCSPDNPEKEANDVLDLAERIRGVAVDDSTYQKKRLLIPGFFIDDGKVYQWGGEPAIVAMSYLLKANINVFNGSDPNPKCYPYKPTYETTYNIAYSNRHYDSIKELFGPTNPVDKTDDKEDYSGNSPFGYACHCKSNQNGKPCCQCHLYTYDQNTKSYRRKECPRSCTYRYRLIDQPPLPGRWETISVHTNTNQQGQTQCISKKEQVRSDHLEQLRNRCNETAKNELMEVLDEKNPDWYLGLEKFFIRMLFQGTRIFLEFNRVYRTKGETPLAVCDFIRNVFLQHWNYYSPQWDSATVADRYSGLMRDGILNEQEIYEQFWGDVLQVFLEAVFNAVRAELENLRVLQPDLFEELCRNTPCLRNLNKLIADFDKLCEYSDEEARVIEGKKSASNLFARSSMARRPVAYPRRP
jgi:hypothetical protein